MSIRLQNFGVFSPKDDPDVSDDSGEGRDDGGDVGGVDIFVASCSSSK